jgi:nicotinate-nucleotide--dimethylbenzimidazole phosphoribosyltransferase
LPAGDDAAAEAVAARQNTLTKPQGSLGRLETLVAWLARGKARHAAPGQGEGHRLRRLTWHYRPGGFGLSSEVTVQMVANFAAGGAAINQLARTAGAELTIIPLDIGHPTGDFTRGPAMDDADFLAAVLTGYRAVTKDLDLLCLGEMGIGNTTTAAAIATALFGGGADSWVGRGTGVDDAGLRRKAKVIDAAMTLHRDRLSDPLAVAAAVGGRELAAMLGAALAARKLGVPLMLDGFVTTSAVAPLYKLNPQGLAHAVAGHVSAEAGHRGLLAALGLDPMLNLGMRLGEGSGGCLAVNILRGALACHTGMASFAEAGVSDK